MKLSLGTAPERAGFRTWARIDGAVPQDFGTSPTAGTSTDDTWGTGPDGTAWIFADASEPWDALQAVGELVTEPDRARTMPVKLRAAARGPLATFGTRLIAALCEQVPDLAETLRKAGPAASIQYEDRYVRSPCAAGQVRSVLKALAELGTLSYGTRFGILTEPAGKHERELTPHAVQDVWTDKDAQRQILELALADLGAPEVAVIIRGKANGPGHRRRLLLQWEGGLRVEVWLDRGLGFAAIKERDLEFDFADEHGNQANALKSADWNLVEVDKHEAYGVVVLTHGQA